MKPRYRRGSDPADRPDEPAAAAQPIIHVPHVRVDVAPDGALSVSVDGAPFTPPEELLPLRRDTFGALADHLTAALNGPIRVEVREADGSTFTDILTPPRRRSRFAPPEPAFPQQASVPAAAVPALIEVSADGFVPGEDVALAVIVAHSDASPTGHGRALLQRHLLELAPTREVLLLGRISGTLSVHHPDRDRQ
ncbi:hypothetical protein ACIGEP_13840 [Microbacterium sp. NPDC077663]|uniref:hypothetical protein n=1 Tax=Microbacterium sp. NPDC077663 TaxID=3364189 RepID=UPI0037C85DE7